MTTLLRTPLYDVHKALGAKMVPFAGWEMPVQYAGILAEHRAVREGAGIFDVCHMGEFEVTGPDRNAFVNRIITNDVAALDPAIASDAWRTATVAAASIGIFLGTLARSMPQLGLLIILSILPLLMLSGGVSPRESMPEIVQHIMLAAPTTYFVRLAQGILYRGAGLDVIWRDLLLMTAVGACFFSVALIRFRKAVTQTQV